MSDAETIFRIETATVDGKTVTTIRCLFCHSIRGVLVGNESKDVLVCECRPAAEAAARIAAKRPVLFDLSRDDCPPNDKGPPG